MNEYYNLLWDNGEQYDMTLYINNEILLIVIIGGIILTYFG